MGTTFQIISVENLTDGLWVVEMKLASKTDPQMNELFQHKKADVGNGRL